MRVIGLAVALAVSLTLAPLAAEAQESGNVYRIGFLSLAVGPAQSFFCVGVRAKRERGLRPRRLFGFNLDEWSP